MLHVVQGDLLESDCNIIGHSCNCFSTMGSGIAKQIKERYPLAYRMDQQYSLTPQERLGRVSFAYYPESPLIIFNLYGQYFYGRGRHTDYTALADSVYEMFEIIRNMPLDVKQKFPHVKLGLPYLMGCVRGGGNWSKVKDILHFYSNEYGIDIYLYKLEE